MIAQIHVLSLRTWKITYVSFVPRRIRNSKNKFIRDALLKSAFSFFLSRKARRKKRRAIARRLSPFVFRHSGTYRLAYLRWKIHSFVTIDAIRAICVEPVGSSARRHVRVYARLRSVA